MKLETINSIWENGRKYTLVKFNDFGFPYSMPFTAHDFRIQPYAQYPETGLLVIKPKGKRNLRGIRIYPHSKFLIFKGWVDPDVEMYRDYDFSDDGQVECKKSLLCFASEYMEIARNSVLPELCLCASY